MLFNITFSKRRLAAGLLAAAVSWASGCTNAPIEDVGVEAVAIKEEQAVFPDDQPEINEGQNKAVFLNDIMAADYIIPPKAVFTPGRTPVAAKGIYISSNRAGSDLYLDPLLELCQKTELNAVVIDVKTDGGFIEFKNGVPLADELGLSRNTIPDIKNLMEKLKANNLYTIARIVTFKDNAAFNQNPDIYIKNKDGTIWRDKSAAKSAWLNPYDKKAWEYVAEIAKSAAKLGFDEIQFDYIRFDTASSLTEADFGETNGKTRREIITEFSKFIVEQLKPYGVYVSADVYGTIINSEVDTNIVGQDYVELAKVFDYLCPMVYPSHYAVGSMGLKYPDIEPYETILRSMKLSNEALSVIPEGSHKAVIRPWLQDFTATWIKPRLSYGAKERQAQIMGAYDAGVTEWILWDAGVTYDAGGLEPNA